MVSQQNLRLICRDVQATEELGEALALAWEKGDLITLEGPLAAGKSALARAAIRTALGDPLAEVPSPTFTLLQTYENGHPGRIDHLDLYRLSDPSELDELGFEEGLQEGVALVEWPQRADGVLGEPALAITVDVEAEDVRIITITGPRLPALRRSLEIREFLNKNNLKDARRQHLTGDASARRYETASTKTDSLIVMDWLPQSDGAVLAEHGLPYSQIAHLAENLDPFVAVAEALTTRGLTAPKILAADYEAGFLLTNHLGTGSILNQIGGLSGKCACSVAETLAFIHEQVWPENLPVGNTGRMHKVPLYDPRALTIETSLLPDWYAPDRLGENLSSAARQSFDALWADLIASLSEAETSIVLRDVHSPNVIWREECDGHERVGLIDFQDAVIGPCAYDVASLAQDARVDVPVEQEAEIVDAYCAARGAGFDRPVFERVYAIMAAQRATKIAGIFVRLSKRDGKHAYLRHLPRIEAYLQRNFAHPVLADYRVWWDATFGPKT